MQLWVLVVSVPQSSPPWAGDGLVHERYLDWVPLPHVLEQPPQLPKPLQPPLTAHGVVLQFLLCDWPLEQPLLFQQDGLLHARDLDCVPPPQFLLQPLHELQPPQELEELQQLVLQFRLCDWPLEQPLLFQQDGLLHARDLDCVPPPQFLLQPLHELQPPQELEELQQCVLQLPELEPEQVLPPFAGDGWVHERDLVPPPQFAEQPLQPLQPP